MIGNWSNAYEERNNQTFSEEGLFLNIAYQSHTVIMHRDVCCFSWYITFSKSAIGKHCTCPVGIAKLADDVLDVCQYIVYCPLRLLSARGWDEDGHDGAWSLSPAGHQPHVWYYLTAHNVCIYNILFPVLPPGKVFIAAFLHLHSICQTTANKVTNVNEGQKAVVMWIFQPKFSLVWCANLLQNYGLMQLSVTLCIAFVCKFNVLAMYAFVWIHCTLLLQPALPVFWTLLKVPGNPMNM